MSPSPAVSRIVFLFLGLAVALALLGCLAVYEVTQQLAEPSPPLPRNPWVTPFVATPNDVVERMLEMAEVKSTDVVYDLGCGDGRIVILAAKKYGCRSIGVEIDPKYVHRARWNVKPKFGYDDSMPVESSASDSFGEMKSAPESSRCFTCSGMGSSRSMMSTQ